MYKINEKVKSILKENVMYIYMLQFRLFRVNIKGFVRHRSIAKSVRAEYSGKCLMERANTEMGIFLERVDFH